jgi:hypothetical protein
MKRNTLTTAVLAGLTGVAGMASVANAVNVNPDGLGQVLLYPYYTARGGNDTLISIVNTTDRGKAVKVRFLEALNSREVLDFNLYMSEYDVWTAGITATSDGAMMRTADTTCTSPYFVGQAGGPGNVAEEPFLDFAFTDPVSDGGPTSLDRTRSGYIEVIEMGTLGVDSVNGEDVEAAARHARSGPGRGIPAPSGSNGSNANSVCGLFQERWTESTFLNGNGIWYDDATRGIEPVSGGLFGNGSIINVDNGTMFTYDAVSLDNFWTAGSTGHFAPGDTNPSLDQGQLASNVFLSNSAGVENQVWNDSIDAVNHVLSQEYLMNEYNVSPGLAANSEWIVTFPTKRQHVDGALGGFSLSAARAPFSQLWTNTSPFSCETIELEVYDREEQSLTFGTDGDVCPSPRPIDPTTGEPIPCSSNINFALCREANVVRWGIEGETAPAMAEITGEPSASTAALPQYGYVNINVPTTPWDFTEGWARFDFSGFTGEASQNDLTFVGLPAIGFWANTYTRNDASTNYGGSFRHRGSRTPLVSATNP